MTFGPFPQTVTVDFDALTADGLFLIHGDTGAGKSTILDGICFALYGAVPGSRDDAKTLHSHHAASDRGPRVELDVTLTNRRLLITRTPEWNRPRRRGTGTTVERAHIEVVERLPEDAERFLTRDHREAADLITAEVGLDRHQFCQVVMLPQGGFARFLQASPDERQGLLRNLFNTDVFTRAEQWLAEHRTTLGQQEREAIGQIRDVVQRVAEVVEAEPPTSLDQPDRLNSVVTWAADHHTKIRELVETLAPELAASEMAERQLDEAWQAAVLLAEQQRDYQLAVQQRDELAQRKPERDGWRRQLELSRAATAVKPYLDQLDRRRVEAESAQRRLIGELGNVPSDVTVSSERPHPVAADWHLHLNLENIDPGKFTQAEREHVSQLHAAQAAIDSETRRTKLLRDRTTTSKRVDDLTARQEKLRISLAELPAQRSELIERRADQLEKAMDRPAAELALAEAKKNSASATRRDTLIPQLATAEEDRRTATDRFQAAEDHYLDVRRRRLAGMAAELAGELTAGDPCAVCGSSDHPNPAQPAVDAVTAADEERAKADADAYQDERRAAELAASRIQTQLTEITEQLGDLTTQQAKAAATDARKRVQAAATAAKVAQELDAQLHTLDATLAEQQAEAAELDRESAAAVAHLESVQGQIDELTALIDQARGQDKTLRLRVARLTDELAAIRSAAEALAAWRQAAGEFKDADLRATAQLTLSPFPDQGQARHAEMTELEIAGLEQRVTDFDNQYSKAQGRADDPALVNASRQPPPDVNEREQAYQIARQRAGELRTRHATLRSRLNRVAQLADDLDKAVRRWTPIRAEHEVANRLAQLVAGTSNDSEIRMTLSTYVLTHRFRHVVSAANTRLEQVTANRYLLRHVIEHDTGRRAGRNGLGLAVTDAWTGQDRRPGTLSGGETFLVSLCLALGLSDVVLAEAGGKQLGSLFIDEGFGSLDEDALDQVIDVLDGLRSGGRTVGLVSHVAELRRRIPTRLHVRKTATGSSIAIIAQPSE